VTQFCFIYFYASLLVSQFSELRKLTRNLASLFGNTCTCEQAFSRTKQNKSKFLSRITDGHLHDVLRWNQKLILLRSADRPKFHISKVTLRYFHCNVEFCVGYGRGVPV
jgi:hypothetical protein